jgi:hypothetical protein
MVVVGSEGGMTAGGKDLFMRDCDCDCGYASQWMDCQSLHPDDRTCWVACDICFN